MEEKNTRLINFVITIGLLIIAVLFRNETYSALLWGATIGSTISSATSLLAWLLSARKNIWTVLRALIEPKLRLSCSYLYRIKVGDHFLLIKSNKHGKFQAVGGNFKRNKYSHDFLSKIEINEDDKFSNGDRAKNDLRLYIKGWNFLKFFKWYNTPDKQREVSYDREFYEELVETGILPSDLFPFPRIDFRKQIVRPFMYSPHLKCNEIHIYDVVELIPTVEQEVFLKELKRQGDTENYKWTTAKIIREQGYQEHKRNTPYEITDNTQVIVDFKYSKNNK